MDFFGDDNSFDGENTQLPLAIQPQRPSSSTVDHNDHADDYGGFESSSGYGLAESTTDSQPPPSERLLIPFPPPPKPTVMLSATEPPLSSSAASSERRQSTSLRKASISSSVPDSTEQDNGNIADQILDWISGCHSKPQQQHEQHTQNSIDSAWMAAEGLMGGGPNMNIHIGEIATRLCSVIAAHKNTDSNEVDIGSSRQDHDQGDAANIKDDVSYDALLSRIQRKCNNLAKPRINDPQSIWDVIWKTSNVTDKSDDGVPFPQDNPSGDLVKAYLRLAEISRKQTKIED